LINDESARLLANREGAAMSADAVHVDLHDATRHLSRIIERVERGEEIIIYRAGTPRGEGRRSPSSGPSP
jgi:hypothetical protein